MCPHPTDGKRATDPLSNVTNTRIQTNPPPAAPNATPPFPPPSPSPTSSASPKTASPKPPPSNPAVRPTLPSPAYAFTDQRHADPAHALRLTTHLLPLLTAARLPPAAHPHLALQRLHLALLLAGLPAAPDAPTLDEVTRVAARAVAGLEALLRAGHPVRGVAVAELGKLLAVDEPAPAPPTNAITDAETSSGGGATDAGAGAGFPPTGSARLALAYGTLQRAHGELLVGFGRANGGGEVGRGVRDTLVALEKEIGAWVSGVRNVREFGGEVS